MERILGEVTKERERESLFSHYYFGETTTHKMFAPFFVNRGMCMLSSFRTCNWIPRCLRTCVCGPIHTKWREHLLERSWVACTPGVRGWSAKIVTTKQV